MNEIWRAIWNYPKYEVSNYGRVRRKKNKRIRKLVKDENGYLRVKLQQNKTPIGVHRLVFEAFYRRLLPNEQPHHLNKIRDCNLSTNLVARDKSLHISQHMKGVKKSEQQKQKQSKSMKGRKCSQQSKAKAKAIKMKNGTWCKKHSQQEKRKMSEAHKGVIFSQEHKRKIGEAKKRNPSLKDSKTGKFLKKENDNENRIVDQIIGL